MKRRIFGITISVAFALGSLPAPFYAGFFASAQSNTIASSSVSQAPDSAVTDKEQRRTELEQQLADLERQINESQDTIDQYKKKGKTLSGEIGVLNTKISKLNLQIKAVNLSLGKLSQEITETQRGINQTENRIDQHKGAISDALQTLYEADSQSLAEVLLSHATLSDFFGNLTNIALVQNNLRIALIEIGKLRQDLVEKKDQYSAQKEDAENLRAIQLSQKKTVESTQKEKSTLLKVTKGKESEYQKILVKTKETAAQIRNQIFELLGGGELTFEKAYDYAQIAERATGVRSAFILAILHRESLLGKNTGRCNYKKAMNPRDIPTFLVLLTKLNIDPDSTVAMVSCPNNDGRYGGAMGPAQFIPSTWKLFENDIARVSGNNPPSPWSNADAFVATGLYLARSGANAKTTASEKKAAATYYCGSNWQRYSCSYYASKVMETAAQYQDNIDILEGKGA